MNGNGNPYQGAQCPVCTTILTKRTRAEAARKNIIALANTERERNNLMTVLYAILREHGGEMVLRRVPSSEEIAANTIAYKFDEDGALRISLPNTVVVESASSIIIP